MIYFQSRRSSRKKIIPFRYFLHDQCNAYQYLNAQGINCFLIFENGTQLDNQTIAVGEQAQVYKGKHCTLFTLYYLMIFYWLQSLEVVLFFPVDISEKKFLTKNDKNSIKWHFQFIPTKYIRLFFLWILNYD